MSQNKFVYNYNLPLTSNRPSGLFLTTGPNDSPGWRNFHEERREAEGGVDIMIQEELRKQHPALQEAWEAYLALLHICNDK